jgi:TolA-binding protein
VLSEYFAVNGNRPYEDRIYSNLGEFYLTKLRYNDAATVYRSFTELNPYHEASPHFSMRVVEIYDEGGFGELVVDAKQEFATKYGLNSAYWQYYDVAEAGDVLGYLKTNLEDLAKHYHALYQTEGLEEEQPENYAQALRWYREYLGSFPQDTESPAINYQLADLLLEHQDFEDAALEYERTAYDYPSHEQSSAAGYAAIFSHREHLKVVDPSEADPALLATVESSLRFADTFPEHEQAPTVLGAAAEDLYDMQDFERALAAGSLLIERYPGAEAGLRRSAWTVVANASFDMSLYPDAELAYSRVLELTPEDDDKRQALYDNLAASIYKQGEAAREVEDYRAAADHFLRISSVAPASTLRPSAEYDAATALMKLEDWDAAAAVFRGFRTAHPDHELQPEVTKQLAFVYQQAGNLSQSATEYEQVANDSDDPEVRKESLLLAASLYEDAKSPAQALAVYGRYVDEYPHPVDVALELRYKMAGMHKDAGARDLYLDQLQQIVAIDAQAGGERTPRTRFLAGKSALVLAEPLYDDFKSLALTQPFEKSLAEKKRRMDSALAAFENLVDYEVAEVTAAATFYMAEIYDHFGAALLNSERPADLTAGDLAEYNMAIEAEAFPFEERAIEVHEKNLELMTAGAFNSWIQRSLDELAVLMPGRYAKAEISSGFIGPVEVFAYRSPAAEVLALDPGSEVSQQVDGAEPKSPDDGTDDDSDGAIDVSAAF